VATDKALQVKRQNKVCAYCGESSVLTREHIWPRCFLARRPGWANFSLAGRRVHGGDQVIRDVCGACNNNSLDALDIYFCELDEKFFSHSHGFGAAVQFQYDYDRLTRALLKIAFNTARANRSTTPELCKTAAYILGTAVRPSGLAVVVELVKPVYVDQTASGLIVPPRELRPEAYRSARTRLETDYADRISTRLVAVNSYFFHIVFGIGDLSVSELAELVLRFSRELAPGSVILDPASKEARLESSQQDGGRSHLPQIAAFQADYREFFGRRKK